MIQIIHIKYLIQYVTSVDAHYFSVFPFFYFFSPLKLPVLGSGPSRRELPFAYPPPLRVLEPLLPSRRDSTLRSLSAPFRSSSRFSLQTLSHRETSLSQPLHMPPHTACLSAFLPHFLLSTLPKSHSSAFFRLRPLSPLNC